MPVGRGGLRADSSQRPQESGRTQQTNPLEALTPALVLTLPEPSLPSPPDSLGKNHTQAEDECRGCKQESAGPRHEDLGGNRETRSSLAKLGVLSIWGSHNPSRI